MNNRNAMDSENLVKINYDENDAVCVNIDCAKVLMRLTDKEKAALMKRLLVFDKVTKPILSSRSIADVYGVNEQYVKCKFCKYYSGINLPMCTLINAARLSMDFNYCSAWTPKEGD